jgi:hypothetical protein
MPWYYPAIHKGTEPGTPPLFCRSGYGSKSQPLPTQLTSLSLLQKQARCIPDAARPRHEPPCIEHQRALRAIVAERRAKQLAHCIQPKNRPLITRKKRGSWFFAEKPTDELRETLNDSFEMTSSCLKTGACQKPFIKSS